MYCEDQLKILAQKLSFKNTCSLYKQSPFSCSCYFVYLNISYTTALHDHDNHMCVEILIVVLLQISLLGGCAVLLDKQFLTFCRHNEPSTCQELLVQ
jgi:hypothetical protein